MNLKRIGSLLLIIMLLFSIFAVPSQAASFSASAGKQTLNIGETTTLSVGVSDCFGQFTITSSNSGVVSVSQGTVWAEGGSQTVTLSAVSAGTATITVTASNVSDTSGDNEITGSKSVTITVNNPTPPPEEKLEQNQNQQNNNGGNSGESKPAEEAPKLTSVTVGKNTYTNLSKGIDITVASNVSSIELKATGTGGTISGTGSKELKTGTNSFNIVIKSPSGKTASCNVIVRRLAEEVNTPNNGAQGSNQVVTANDEPQETPNEEQPPEEEPISSDLRLIYLTIDNVEITPAFDSETFEYWATVTNRTDLEIVAAATDDHATVEITGNEELKEGENDVVVKITKDEETVQYVIHVTKLVEDVIPVGSVEDQGGSSGGLFWAKVIPLIIIVAVVGALGAAFAFERKTEKITGRTRHSRRSYESDKDF